jgi:hypothetical protein
MAPIFSLQTRQSIGWRERRASKPFGCPARDTSAASASSAAPRYQMSRWTARCSRCPPDALMAPSKFVRPHISVVPVVRTGTSVWIRLRRWMACPADRSQCPDIDNESPPQTVGIGLFGAENRHLTGPLPSHRASRTRKWPIWGLHCLFASVKATFRSDGRASGLLHDMQETISALAPDDLSLVGNELIGQ